MSAAAELFGSADFRSAALPQQVAALTDAYPGFQQLPEASQKKMISKFLKEFEPEDEHIAAMQRGLSKAMADQAYWASNALELIPGDSGEGKDGVIEKLREFTKDIYDKNPTPKDADFSETLAEVIGGLPIHVGAGMAAIGTTAASLMALGVPGATAAILAPAIGIGAQSAIGASEAGFVESMKAGLEGAAFGAMFPALQHLSRPMRAAIMGGAVYGMSDPNDSIDKRLSESLTMAGMMAWSKSRGAIDPILRLQGKPTRAQALAKEKIKNSQEDAVVQNQVMDEFNVGRIEENARVEGLVKQREAVEAIMPDTSAAENLRRVDIGQEAPARSGPQADGGRLGERPVARGATELEQHAIRTKPTDYKRPDAVDENGGRLDLKGRSHNEESQIRFDPKPGQSRKADGKEVIKNPDVIAKLFKAFGVGVDYSGLKEPLQGAPKVIKGQFKRSHEPANGGLSADEFSQHLTVLRRGDLPTHVHEFGHNLSSFSPLGKAMHQDPAIKAKYYTPVSHGGQRVLVENLPSWLKELHHLSYDVRKVEEGFAEFVKHWLSNPNYLMKEAPNAFARFEAALSKLPPDQLKALRTAQQEIGEYYKQPPGDILEGSIGPAKDPGEVLHTWADEKIQKNVDDFHGVTNMVRRLGIEDANNVSEAFYRTRSTTEIGEMMWSNGAPKLKVNPKSRMDEFEWRSDGEIPLEIMLDVGRIKRDAMGNKYRTPKHAQQDFMLYAVAVQARELKGQALGKHGEVVKATQEDVNLGRTREKLLPEEAIQAGEMKATPEFEKAATRLMKYMNEVADFGQQMGLFSAEQRAMWMRRMYMFSFHREMSAGRKGLGGKRDELASIMGVERMFGSARQLKEPLQNLMDGPARMIDAAFKNRARTELADVSNVSTAAENIHPQMRPIDETYFQGQNPQGVKGAGKFLSRVPERHERVMLSRAELTKFMEKELNDLYGIRDPAEMKAALKWLGGMPEKIEEIAIFLGGSKPLDPNVMTIIRNGRREYYHLNDQLLVRAVAAMNRPMQQDVLKTWGRLKAFKTMMIVAEPGFILANLARDTISANIMTRTGKQHLTAGINGMYHTVFQTKQYKEFALNGGAGSVFRKNMKEREKQMTRQLKRENLNPTGVMMNPVKFMNQIGRSIENWNRVGEYVRGVNKGMGKRHSAFLAREVSTDFSRKGDSMGLIGFANATIPFFSAMIAGQHRIYRANFRDPNGRAGTATKIATLGVMSAAGFMLNEWLADTYGDLEDENGKQMVDWKGLPPWARAAYWHSYVPTEFDRATGRPTKFRHFMLPKPWEIGLVGTWAELAMEGGLNDIDDDHRNLWWEAGQQALATFGVHLPEAGSSGSPVPIPLPVGIDIAFEQLFNKIAFTGADIETPAMQGVLPQERYRSNQTRTMQEIGRVTGKNINMGAARGEALLRGLFGHWANMGLQFSDQMFYYGPSPDMDIDDLPGIRRFYASPEKYSSDPTGFYDNLRTAAMIKGTLNRYMAEGNREDYNELMDDPVLKAQAGQSAWLGRASDSLQAMHREQRLLRWGTLDPHATSRERFNSIERIEKERLSLMKIVNRQVRAQNRRARKRRDRQGK
jgi:hypothetical protein